MLLTIEEDLDTCAQETWAMKVAAVSEFVGAPEEQRLFCGISISYEDGEKEINRLRTKRLATEYFVTVV